MQRLQTKSPPVGGIQAAKFIDKRINSNGYEGQNGYFNDSKGLSWPDHTQLPFDTGTFVKNFQEHPQSILITDSIDPVLQELHPDGQYAIGQDSGIYWRLPKPPEELYKGAEAPDWFYVPGVPPLLDGKIRGSYVMWREHIAPLVVMEFVSGDGTEEKDQTPFKGKFWVYEQAIKPLYYAIYFVNPGQVELYHLENGIYHLVLPNERGHYPIEPLGVELGIWRGVYKNADLPWLRCWDASGNLLLTGEERAKEERLEKELALKRAASERQRAELERKRAQEERLKKEVALNRPQEERQRAESERKRAQEERLEKEAALNRAQQERLEKEVALKRAERLAAQLRALGIEPDEP